jgi:hypothetical protein
MANIPGPVLSLLAPRRLTGEPEAPKPRAALVEVPYAEVARMNLTVHTRR